MRDGERRAFPHIVAQLVGVELRLQFVGGQHHDDVGPFGRFGIGHDLEAGVLGLLRRGRAGAQRHDDVLDAAVAQIVGVGVALAAIADDRDLFRLDQVHIRIAVVIHAHVPPPFRAYRRPRESGGPGQRPERRALGSRFRGNDEINTPSAGFALRQSTINSPRRARSRRRRCAKSRPDPTAPSAR